MSDPTWASGTTDNDTEYLRLNDRLLLLLQHRWAGFSAESGPVLDALDRNKVQLDFDQLQALRSFLVDFSAMAGKVRALIDDDDNDDNGSISTFDDRASFLTTFSDTTGAFLTPITSASDCFPPIPHDDDYASDPIKPLRPQLRYTQLPLEAHSEIATYLNTYDCQSLAKTCSALRRVYGSLSWRRCKVQRQIRLSFDQNSTTYRFIHDERPILTTIKMSTAHQALPFKALCRPQNFAWFDNTALLELVVSVDPLDPSHLPTVTRHTFPSLNRVVFDGLADADFVQRLADSAFFHSVGTLPGSQPVDIVINELVTLQHFDSLKYATEITLNETEMDPEMTPMPLTAPALMPNLRRIDIQNDDGMIGPASCYILHHIRQFPNLQALSALALVEYSSPTTFHPSIRSLARLPASVTECSVRVAALRSMATREFISFSPSTPLVLPRVTSLDVFSIRTYKAIAPYLHLPGLRSLTVVSDRYPDVAPSSDMTARDLPALALPLSLYSTLTYLELGIASWHSVPSNLLPAMLAMPALSVFTVNIDGLSFPGTREFLPADDITLKYLMEVAYQESINEPMSTDDIFYMFAHQHLAYGGSFDPTSNQAGSKFGTGLTSSDNINTFLALIQTPSLSFSSDNMARFTRPFFLISFYEALFETLSLVSSLAFLRINFRGFHYPSPALQRLLFAPPERVHQIFVSLRGTVIHQRKGPHFVDPRVYTTDLMELVPKLPTLYTTAASEVERPLSLLEETQFTRENDFLYTYGIKTPYHRFDEMALDSKDTNEDTFNGWYLKPSD